ncbi:hypothetical protein MIMGU_mgv1a000807mg [Erythranthe guttata]|uniref:CCR4-Not complex component Not N-terminal domain-containing protein n=1 Tax=Erythranthe guttata TaxID=4155 RepID=A0A022Q2C1_ERYGU|nr:hypothetical protein MIMGU_mgv1a000807mg [Erythranthe guttata]
MRYSVAVEVVVPRAELQRERWPPLWRCIVSLLQWQHELKLPQSCVGGPLQLAEPFEKRGVVDHVGDLSRLHEVDPDYEEEMASQSLRGVYDTDNANQKEKFEADLKKEIKKLQRYRDQIKTWIQSSEIKDKKVSASYEQALMDARKQIEREMERFKICEKETKTKAFSKEGLGQQPKTDPKEKAKGETRDWLNNAVSELENQIDSFEAEIEGLSVKKGKTRPPRLTHLETSIGRHKAHIMKLELILRLLDNDELSPEQVNDVNDYVKRNQEDLDEFSDVDELYSSLPLDKVESLESPLGNRVILSQAAKASDGLGSADTGNVSDAAIMGSRVFTSPVVPGMQWRPGSSFQNQNEAAQFRGRTEIAPDQREKFLQRFQQVTQQCQTNVLGMPPLAGGKQYSAQQQNLLLQQFNAQSSSISPQLGMGIGVQTSGLSSVATSASLQQQPSAIHQSSNQQAVITSTSKDAETSLTKVEALQQQQLLTEDLAPDYSSNSGLGKSLVQEDELKTSHALETTAAVASGPLVEPSQVMRETDLSPGQPLQPASSSGSLGVIGRRSVSDLGAIGDNISALTANSGGMHDQIYNLQMLKDAYYGLPQPKDSERARTYTPATTSASVQQTPPSLDQVDETAFQDDAVARTPPPKSSSLSISAPQPPASGLATSAITSAGSASSPVAVSSPIKELKIANFPGRKSSPALAETGLRAIGKGGLLSQPTSNILPSSGNTISSNGTIPLGSEIGKRNILVSDDRSASSGIAQYLVSPLGNRVILSQAAKASDGLGSADTGNVSDAAIMGSRVFTSPVVPGMQWRPGSSFQNQNEAGQFRGRTEIAPDQREKFLQRFQQVTQQCQTNVLGMPPLAGGKQYSAQQQNLLLQQFNAQSSSISPLLGMGIGVQTSGLSSVATSASLQPQPSAIHQSSNQQAVISSTSKDAETSLTKVEELQQQQPLTEDLAPDYSSNSGLGKSLVQEDELKTSHAFV